MNPSKLPLPEEFLRYLLCFLIPGPSVRTVSLYFRPYLDLLIARGKRMDAAPDTPIDLEAVVQPLLKAPTEDELSARTVAANIFLSVLDASERSVLPDLDPLIGALLLVFDDENWRMLLKPVVQRMGRMLCPKAPDPEASVLEFFGYEVETRYKNGRSYLQAIRQALREKGEAGGLLRLHYRWFSTGKRRFEDKGWGSLDDTAQSLDGDPLESAILAEMIERETGGS
jgi:hypothetical protein